MIFVSVFVLASKKVTIVVSIIQLLFFVKSKSILNISFITFLIFHHLSKCTTKTNTFKIVTRSINLNFG